MIPHQRGNRTLFSYLTEAEMRALLAAPKRSTEQGNRDYVMLLFLYNSAACASDAASLLIQDVDTQSRLVHITGKGKKQRVCPLWLETIGHLRRLIAQRPKDEPLFQNRLRQPITRFGIHTLVGRHAARAAEQEPSMRSTEGQPAHHQAFDSDAPASSRRRYQHNPGMVGACQHQHDERVRRS